MRRIVIAVSLILFLLPGISVAKNYFGAKVSYIVVSHEISQLYGMQGMLTLEPECLNWGPFQLYFDGGFSHFWVTSTPYYTTLNIYSAAPILRYNFYRWWKFKPYIEASVGLAYLNHTHLDSRNLGMHFAFQDRLGVGTFIGRNEQVYLGLHAAHYSNAHLCGHNSGFTLPLILDIGLRFN